MHPTRGLPQLKERTKQAILNSDSLVRPASLPWDPWDWKTPPSGAPFSHHPADSPGPFPPDNPTPQDGELISNGRRAYAATRANVALLSRLDAARREIALSRERQAALGARNDGLERAMQALRDDLSEHERRILHAEARRRPLPAPPRPSALFVFCFFAAFD